MSRFDYDDYDGEGQPYALWERALSNALGGRRGQEALAEVEAALVALPASKLIDSHLVEGGQVCAIGAFVAHRIARREGIDIAEAIAAMVDRDDGHETAEAGAAEGLTYTIAWHLAYLNDEKFRTATPEERYEQMLAWVRRAQGKAIEATA